MKKEKMKMKVTKVETIPNSNDSKWEPDEVKIKWSGGYIYTVQNERGEYYYPGVWNKWHRQPRYLSCKSVPQVIGYIKYRGGRKKITVKKYKYPETPEATITYE